jgi:(p)ppGpp synthase/HD superfamily hydrolase
MGWSREKYIAALRFAALAHGDQKLPDGDIPYLFHLGLVSMEVIAALEHEQGMDGDLAVSCAILHDTIEDAAVSHDELRDEFGHAVADGVMALTKNKALGKKDAMADSIRRIKLQPQEVWMVKLADRITNLQPPPKKWGRDRIIEYHAEALLIYESLKSGSSFLADRLKMKIDEYRKYCS